VRGQTSGRSGRIVTMSDIDPVSGRPAWPVLWDWVADAQRRIEAATADLDDEQLRAPSLLTDWTRGHVLVHLSLNARALTNLLTWAETGIETPMYPSMQARADDIAAAADNAGSVQRRDLIDSGERLRAAAEVLPVSRRTYEVRTAQGRPVPALEVPWMRNREVWLHFVDLDLGFTIDDLPADVARELIADVAGWMTPRLEATVDLVVDGAPAPVRLGSGPDASSVISGSSQQLAGWLTGRLGPQRLASSGEIPTLPPWL
jgi:maleylpyruvate isomerase